MADKSHGNNYSAQGSRYTVDARGRDLSFDLGNTHYSSGARGWYMYTWLAVLYIFGGAAIAIVGTVMSLQG